MISFLAPHDQSLFSAVTRLDPYWPSSGSGSESKYLTFRDTDRYRCYAPFQGTTNTCENEPTCSDIFSDFSSTTRFIVAGLNY